MVGDAVSSLSFIKMHGAGNDYVFVDGFSHPLPQDAPGLAIAVSHRHFGIGADGLVLLSPPADDASDVEMRMWNADGSEGALCGNAARCVALWMNVNGRLAGPCRIKMVSRVVTVETLEIDAQRQAGRFCVDHGPPQIDAVGQVNLESLSAVAAAVDLPQWPLKCVSLSMGNPHAVFVVDEITDQLVRGLGPAIEKSLQFVGGTNVEWVRAINRQRLEVRVWERGSGETLACGSGACAAVVACVQQGFCDRNVDVLVELPGGRLSVRWSESGSVFLTGPAEVSFKGVWGG